MFAGTGVATSQNKKWINLNGAIKTWQNLSNSKEKTPLELETVILRSNETREIPNISIPQMSATMPLIRLSFCENEDRSEKIFFYYDDESVIREKLGFTMINDCFSSKRIVNEEENQESSNLQVGEPIQLPVPQIEVREDWPPKLTEKRMFRNVEIPCSKKTRGHEWISLYSIYSCIKGVKNDLAKKFLKSDRGKELLYECVNFSHSLDESHQADEKILFVYCSYKAPRTRCQQTPAIRAIDLPRLASILDKREAMLGADTRGRVLAGDKNNQE